jgi:2-succinyl-6-hydroxy-2,4-cyclohexadiene-1-carboxylate synthase
VTAAFPGRRVLAPRLFGHGPHGDADEARSFEEEIDRLAALIRSEAGAHTTLAGYSLGARFALGLLVRHPELFSRAVLIGVNPGLSLESERVERAAGDERWAKMLEGEGVAAFADAWASQPLFASQSRLSAEVQSRERDRRLSHTAVGLAASLRLHGLAQVPDWTPFVARIEQPVTLLAGALDTKFVRIAEALVGQLPRGRLHVVEEVGHNIVLERADAVVRALEEA